MVISLLAWPIKWVQFKPCPEKSVNCVNNLNWLEYAHLIALDSSWNSITTWNLAICNSLAFGKSACYAVYQREHRDFCVMFFFFQTQGYLFWVCKSEAQDMNNWYIWIGWAGACFNWTLIQTKPCLKAICSQGQAMNKMNLLYYFLFQVSQWQEKVMWKETECFFYFFYIGDSWWRHWRGHTTFILNTEIFLNASGQLWLKGLPDVLFSSRVKTYQF